MRPLSIAVVGCGPAGMAAALFLARAGHSPKIFERFEAPHAIGAGLMLQPTGQAVLRRLGLLAAIESLGARIDRLHGMTPSGRIVLDMAYADLGQARGDGAAPFDLFGIGIHRAALFDQLFAAIMAHSIDLVPGTEIVGSVPGTDSRRQLRGRDGRLFGPFDLVIDASGAGSQLRSDLGLRDPKPFRYGALWTTLPLAGHSFAGNVLAQRYVAARHMVGVMPLNAVAGREGPHAALFWSLPAERLEDWHRDGLDRWKDEVAAIWPEAAALLAPIDHPDQMSRARYRHFTARRTAWPGLVLIGDAAHTTSPQLGQGLNMGLVDAMILADAIASESSIEDGLARYQARRWRHVRTYQQLSLWMTPLFQSESAGAAMLRDGAMPILRRIPWARREMVRMLAGLKSSLVTSLDPKAPFGD